MHSIRTKFTTLTVCEIVLVMIITAILGIKAISKLGNESSNKILYYLCEDEQRTIDEYFKSIEQSTKTISEYAEQDLKNTTLDDLESHLARVEDLFEKTARNTNGVLTYYYRIDPDAHASAKGFWYVYDSDESGFKEHEVTDIAKYDDDDPSMVWFSVPKNKGKSLWLQPYFTANLDEYVLSYNVPVYKEKKFIGVIGIEIDYDTIANSVNNVELYDNGYAFINDYDGNIICHPKMAISEFTGGKKPVVPEGLMTTDRYITYTYNGVKKQAVQLPLHNGMRLVVTVPESEINATLYDLVGKIIPISLLLTVIFALFTMRMAGHITKPLRKLTHAAAQLDAGNYDFELDYGDDDEVGALSKTFGQMAGHIKAHIRELNDLAYSDPLTSVHNKGAFDVYTEELQTKLINSRGNIKFAIGIFDCNNLKPINDNLGHDKGDLYLKATASVICRVFSHSPVFRVGGDEFAVILQNDDYHNRKKLMRLFNERVAKAASENERWQQVSIAVGIAVFDPKIDKSVNDVCCRADDLMYENKRMQKGE